MKTAVINNREGLVQAQLPPTMFNKQGAPVLSEAVTFLPGANLVDSAKLDQLRKNSAFELNFNTKIPKSPAPEQNPEKVGLPILQVLEVEHKTKDGAKMMPLIVEDKAPLAKLAPEVAQKLIDEVLVESTLREWLREETRPEMAHALNKRIAELQGEPEGGPAAMGR
jgi:hypothetical protein